jgi:hypothetical protein
MPKAKPKTEKEGVFDREVKVVNIGIPTFADDLASQGVPVVKVDWKPPAGGDTEMLGILEKLGA